MRDEARFSAVIKGERVAGFFDVYTPAIGLRQALPEKVPPTVWTPPDS